MNCLNSAVCGRANSSAVGVRGPILMPQQMEENLRDDVGFRQPGSSFRRQADEAGQSKEAKDACDVSKHSATGSDDMAKLVYELNQSLDGYIDHQEFAPGPALF